MMSNEQKSLRGSVARVLKIFRLSLNSANKNKFSLINMGGLVFVCLVTLELWFPYGAEGEDGYLLSGFGIDLINIFVSLLVFSMFLVYGHKCVLMPQQKPQGWFVMRVTSVEWRFAWLTLVVGLLFVPLLLMSFVPVFILASGSPGADTLGALHSSEEQTVNWLTVYIFFLYALGALLFSRIALSAPLVVLGFDRPIERAWRLSKGCMTTLFILIVAPAALQTGLTELIDVAAAAI